ncbi:IclR family transcriptional regulator [Pseudoruegeria sp. SK021]|uniref:IclR family transcriptional regulator n=1 Tax=Pseudoruegeria sp. SK021 TaxID=1933035 RepID=UPI00197F319A|nr:IclR family transcriptional regulator [Pseudoruegeria sp. SK021]
MVEKTDRSGIQVIARAAAILRVLKDHRSGLSLGQIAAAVSLPRSTVQRITGALATEGLIISDPSGGGLRLGPELGSLAEAANYSIVERCRLLLTEITNQTGETTDLAVVRGEGMVFLDQVPGLHRLRTVSSVGDVFPLTSTANGRACLAMMPESDALQLATQEWRRSGQHGDLADLRALLAIIRQTGLAYDTDEHSQGISAIGFAFQDWSGSYYAISVPVPSTRFPEVREDVKGALLRARKNVADVFGTAVQ